MYQANLYGESWQSLALPQSFISLKKLGDLGPSGADPGGQARRQASFAQLAPKGLTIMPGTENCLVCHQVHSLKIVILLRGQAPKICQAEWDAAMALRFSKEPLALPPGTESWEDLGPALPAWVGQIDADGLICDNPDYWLGITVADCLPLLFEAALPNGQAIRGALHSGWGGTGILAIALWELAELGAGNLRLHLGPCIGAADYPVPPERGELFRRRFGDLSVINCADGQPGLDLIAANQAILSDPLCPANRAIVSSDRQLPWSDLVGAAQIIVESASTFATPNYQSFRRDTGQNYGRMLAMIGPGHA